MKVLAVWTAKEERWIAAGNKKSPACARDNFFYKALVISFSLVSIGLDALAFQGLDRFFRDRISTGFQRIGSVLIKGKNRSWLILDFWFGFSWNWTFYKKTYWTAVFKDLDGLISDQSTSDTKLLWQTLLCKSETALFGVYGFYWLLS